VAASKPAPIGESITPPRPCQDPDRQCRGKAVLHVRLIKATRSPCARLGLTVIGCQKAADRATVTTLSQRSGEARH